MKTLAAVLVSGILLAVSARSEPATSSNKGPVCIRPFDTPTGSIDHTHVVDPTTILFYMRDGKIWKNTLHEPCRGLMLHGFTFLTRHDEICSNAQSIRVIKTGQVCQLGEFTPYAPPSESAPAH